MNPTVEEHAAADWVRVLGELPQSAIERACDDWLRCEQKRPTPAGIRALALEWVEIDKPRFVPRAKVERPEPAPPTEESKARAAEIVAECVANLRATGKRMETPILLRAKRWTRPPISDAEGLACIRKTELGKLVAGELPGDCRGEPERRDAFDAEGAKR